MEQELYEAIERALAKNKIKNISTLCDEAGVHQPSVSTWIKTRRALNGAASMPRRPKEHMLLDVASKLIEYLGGRLVFPDDDNYNLTAAEIIELREENEKLKSENIILDKKLYACEQIREKFEEMINRQLPTGQYEPAEIRQNKSSA